MLDDLKANNRAWAERMISLDPKFFQRLEAPAGAAIFVDRLFRQPGSRQ